MSKQTDTAFLKGMTARQDGAERLENPYRDLHTDRDGVTFSRAFRRSWFEGWDMQNEMHQLLVLPKAMASARAAFKARES